MGRTTPARRCACRQISAQPEPTTIRALPRATLVLHPAMPAGLIARVQACAPTAVPPDGRSPVPPAIRPALCTARDITVQAETRSQTVRLLRLLHHGSFLQRR